MTDTPLTPSTAAPGMLALRPRDAAKAIGVSARTLWTLTKKGEIPHFRIGRSLLYPVDALRAWLRERAGMEVKP